MTIGNRIKECRIKMGITQEELAEKMCIKKQTISAYENDRIDLKVSVLKELVAALETTVSYLVEGGEGESDTEIKQITILLKRMHNTELRKVALEQIKALSRLEKNEEYV